MNWVIRFLELDNKNKYINYGYFLFLVFGIILIISIFNDILQIHIYRHDALYYTMKSAYHTDKVISEGRWINALVFDLFSNINGKVLSVFILTSFGYFIFIITNKWTKNIYYSMIVALLFVQIPSFYDLIGWPPVTAPTFVILLSSIYLHKKIKNIFLFFLLFGVLFFGTMSNYYYLLPLLYLEYFLIHDWKQNSKFIFYKLLPAWALGFIFGYIITQFIVYVDFGHFMSVADWRQPHYIHSLNDLQYNVLHSLNFLETHLKSIFINIGLLFLFISSIIIATIDRKKDLVFIPLLIFFLITIIHYIVILPIGIYISPRTIVATWVGVFAVAFLVPSIKEWQIYLLVPVIIIFMYTLYSINHNNLQWYAGVTNTYFNDFVKNIPKNYNQYDYLILCATDLEMKTSTEKIVENNNFIKEYYIENFNEMARWIPIGYEAGFKQVILCDKNKTVDSLDDKCKEIMKVTNNCSKTIKNTGLYRIIGEYDKILVIAFDDIK